VGTHKIELSVDGTTHQCEANSRKLLVHLLRDDLDITSTNIGCDTSQCGACTISINNEIVKSCTILAVQANGAEIETVASQMSEDTLSIIQQSFKEKHGLQCGYCTPGMVMTTAELLKNDPNPTEEVIRESLHGNICRCTGYGNIIDAVTLASEKIREGASI